MKHVDCEQNDKDYYNITAYTKRKPLEGEFVDEKFFTSSGFLFYTHSRAALREGISLLNSKSAERNPFQDPAANLINVMGTSPVFRKKDEEYQWKTDMKGL